MKRSLLMFALLSSFGGAAMAQTNVTIYGLADLGIDFQSGGPAGRVIKLSSGITTGSRLGFRGTEDLGGGLSAQFLLESGFAMDTGASTQGGLLFGRQIYVGLGNSFGTVTMGRQYTSVNNTLCGEIDPFNCGLAGTASNLMSVGGTPTNGGSGSRTNNALKYAIPTIGGLSGDIVYGFGEVAGNSSAARTYGGSLAYKQGALTLVLAHNNVNDATATNSAKVTFAGGKYDFGVAAVRAGVAVNKGAFSGGTNVPQPDSRDYIVGVSVPFGAGTFLASYIKKNDLTATDNDASQIGIGYLYSLSKRTTLYTSYAHIHNTFGNTLTAPPRFYTVGNALDGGTGDSAFNVGIRHTF